MTTHVASCIKSINTTVVLRFARRLERLRDAFCLPAAVACSFVLADVMRANQTASLAWNPVTNSSVMGYALYIGNAAGGFTNRIDVGTNTQITVAGLKEGNTVYFAVSAYNSVRIESPISSSVPYLVPGVVRYAPPGAKGAPGIVSFPVAVGHSYELQASTNLSSWVNLWQTPVWTSNAWEQYSDSQSSTYPRRFYRLIMQ